MEEWKELPLVLIGGTTSWKDLPILLKTDILSRLPVKSLIRSTSVCKSWYTHIKKPTFISAHINRSIKNGPHHSLLFAPTASHTFTLITHNHQTKLEIPFRTHSNSVNITGSCHGLICLADASPFHFGRDLYLWNPSVNKHKHIPSSRSCFATELSDWTDTYPAIGFGFHKPHNDYRIVRIVYCAETRFEFLDKVAHKVEVYSLRKDCWRRVKTGTTVTRMASHERWAFLNGVVYWLEAKRDNSYNWILSFDFNDEVFGEVQLPRNFRDGVGRDAHAIVSDYKGLLGLCVFDLSADYGGSERLCVWVRKEEGAPERKRMVWKKQLKVVLKDRIGWPLKFTKSGELILEALEDLGPRRGARHGGGGLPDLKRLVLHDLEKLRYKDLGSDGRYAVDTSFMESLLLFEDQKPLFRRTASLE